MDNSYIYIENTSVTLKYNLGFKNGPYPWYASQGMKLRRLVQTLFTKMYLR